MTLSQSPINQLSKISHTTLKSTYKKRIEELGLTPQALVSVIRKSPLGDPIIINIKGKSIILSKEVTDQIHLENA